MDVHEMERGEQGGPLPVPEVRQTDTAGEMPPGPSFTPPPDLEEPLDLTPGPSYSGQGHDIPGTGYSVPPVYAGPPAQLFAYMEPLLMAIDEDEGKYQTPGGSGRHGAQRRSARIHETSRGNLLENGEEFNDPTPALGGRLNNSQWRPEKDNNNVDIQTVIATMTAEFAKVMKKQGRSKPVIFPTFEGNKFEDPVQFLRKMEALGEQEGYSKDELTKLVTDQLRADACRWYGKYSIFAWDYEMFKQQFLGKFDGPGVTDDLQAELYGERQGEEEVAYFIAKKVALFKRLRIIISEEAMVSQIRRLIKPQLRLHLVGFQVQTVAHLTTLANEVEEIAREQRPSGSSRPMSSNPGVNNEVQRRTRPMTGCYTCGGAHLNRECPRRGDPVLNRERPSIEGGPPAAGRLALPAPERQAGNGPRVPPREPTA